VSGRMPSRLRTEREQRAGQAAEEVGFGTCRGERKAGGLDDTGGDFQETKSQRRELGSGQFPGFGNGVAHGKHQPISGGVENEADLIGERRTAARAIGGELCLMQLDQILGLAARAIQAVVGNLSTPKSVQKLQTALHAKAKAEAGYRFYALYDKISREDILAHAYAQCRSNKGAPGVDGQDFCGNRRVWCRAVAWRTGATTPLCGCAGGCAPSTDVRAGLIHSRTSMGTSGSYA
jgi:hypothetical protein